MLHRSPSVTMVQDSFSFLLAMTLFCLKTVRSISGLSPKLSSTTACTSSFAVEPVPVGGSERNLGFCLSWKRVNVFVAVCPNESSAWTCTRLCCPPASFELGRTSVNGAAESGPCFPFTMRRACVLV